ncbi:MAG TPA: type II toxin-antitoxin system PemK/MazF family toxin [Xanthobacteraceae bacterium]|nr:type II toxin-antitoxin system PemK/MazF family toxin [Xanthobacteraceae bacterium]
MAVKRGDVVIVAYGELGRPRPAIIVQADELGGSTTTLVACPITSEVVEKLAIRPIVEATDSNGLHVRSQIMTDRLLAIPRARVRQAIGTIDAQTSDRLDGALLLVLGLTR